MSSVTPANILCIDDEPQLLADIVDELEREGYKVQAAANARQAVELVEARSPDLILCDISMPGGDGYALLQALRSRNPALYDVPFIFLSALAEPSQIVLGKRLGADDYLTKPVDYDLLLATVAARLAQVERMRTGIAADINAQRLELAGALVANAYPSFAIAGDELDRLAIGLVHSDGSGLVLNQNATASDILEEADGIGIIARRIVAMASAPAADLRRAIGEVANSVTQSSSIVVQRDYRRPLLIRLTALPASGDHGGSIFVTLVDPERGPGLSPEIASQLYGLTPTEAKLAIAIAEGARPEEISRRFKIAQSTINFHLNSVFRKTDTSRQVDLVALLIRTAVSNR